MINYGEFDHVTHLLKPMILKFKLIVVQHQVQK